MSSVEVSCLHDCYSVELMMQTQEIAVSGRVMQFGATETWERPQQCTANHSFYMLYGVNELSQPADNTAGDDHCLCLLTRLG